MDEINTRYTPEQWVNHYQKNYVNTLTLDAATRIIKNDMTNMARTCVSIGFHLKAVRDKKLFQDAGYETLWDYAADQFGLSTSSASRYMTINDQFSVGGNTPQLQEKYRNFSKSQLQEMITMSTEQRQQVTEKMTVKEIRQMKNPEPAEQPAPEEEEQIPGQMEMSDYPDVLPEEPVATSQRTGKCLYRPEFMCTLADEDKKSPGTGENCNRHCCWSCVKHGDCKLECSSSADRPGAAETQQKEENAAEVQQGQKAQPLSVYGLPIRTYPPDSLIATSGCGKHDCFSCHMDGCQIREEECYCVEAPMGNPFPCTTLNVVDDLREEVGDRCQFVNHDLAFHREGDGELVPCCKECENPCGYECRRSVDQRSKQKQEEETELETTGDNSEELQVEKLPDESWNMSDLPQAKESLLRQLARVLVDKMGDRMVISAGRLSAIISDETARERIQELDRIEGGSIRLQDNVAAYASSEIIEFYREDEDLGVCSYARFGTQVRIAFDEWLAKRNDDKLEQPVIESGLEEERLSDMHLLCSMLEKEKRDLEEFIQVDKVDKLPEDMIRKKKILVAALANMKCDWEDAEIDKSEQPELPIMKNNEQRKEWLRNYKDWGLWYEDEHIGCRYYKYEFENGAVLIAEEYDCSNQYVRDYTTSYLHLVGGPEPPKHSKYGLGRWQRNERYNRYPNNETELVEFLKEVQKGAQR